MPIILNKAELATSNLRKNALDILEAGLEAINTEKILRRKISVVDGILKMAELPSLNVREGFGGELYLKSFEKIFFVGIGKCALDGAKVIENILGDYLTDGIALGVIADSTESFFMPKKIRSFAGTHPYPSEQNVEITKKILEMVKGLTEKDLVITLISGGGSALFELPIEGVSLNEIIETTKKLTAKGADIYELNKVRKEMSQVKGGKFAELCRPAKMISLLFSDVLGNDISIIASGPTVLPSSSQGEGQFREAERGGVMNILIASNHDALEAMKSKAEELGFNTTIETEKLSGNARDVGKELALRKLEPKNCLLFGGETTVIIPENHGVGGRNQEVALAALSFMQQNSILICVASDGFDNTDHAGAIADIELFEKSKSLNISPEEYLKKSDSYNFFKKVGGALYTEKLGSNVSDLCIIIRNG
ncbi:MAG: DUF4147 domain-containing protein [Patescibacteria group bacterium]